MNIRDEIITGTFAIGPDGQREPIDWKDYALKLEEKIKTSSIPTEEQWGNLIDEFYHEYRRYEKDPDEDELPYARGVRVGKGNTYANVVHRMRELSVSSAPRISHWTTSKPKFDREFSFATAHFWKDHWEYKIWQIVKVDNPEGWYYGLCEGDGEEWGDHDDIQAKLYYILPEPKQGI